MRKKLWLLAIVGAVLLSAGQGWAEVGTLISSLPYTITAPGFYYVDSNLTCASGDGITVKSDDVTIDLKGFRLSGNGGYSTGIFVESRSVEIRNGVLSGWGYGIWGFYVGFNHRVLNVRVEDNAQYGIMLDGFGHLVKGCSAWQNRKCGIYAYEGAITGNVVYGGQNGIMSPGGAVINGNVISNLAARGSGDGIHLGGPGSVIGNTVINCPSYKTGINISSEHPIMVDQNSVSGAGTHYSPGSALTAWGTNAGR